MPSPVQSNCDAHDTIANGHPCDFFLFPKLKNHLKGHHFGTLENIQTAVTDQLKAIPISEFHQCYEEWKKRLQRCVASEGSYFEGDNVEFDKSTEDFPVICYTDGSKIDGRVGFAFVVFRSGVECENFQFRIRDECTVFVAELLFKFRR
ncbi:putative transposase [Trichonephila clavipes]|nr:putative transposase [Trichonephila clavipes]